MSKIITAAIAAAFAKQGDTSEKEAKDIKIILKLFGGPMTVYIYDQDWSDPEKDGYWAFVDLGDPICAECGYVSLSELMALKIPPFGLPLEHDRFYEGETLAEVEARYDKIRQRMYANQ